MIALINGNAERIPLKDGSVHVCVTSPPYYGLRKYAIEGDAEIGLEDTPELYLERMVAVSREVWRVLRDDGVYWLNMGDSYAGSNKGVMSDGTQVGGSKQMTNTGSVEGLSKAGTPKGLKPLDLMNIPSRLVLALQADGWYHRSTIIWSKKNPMPESVNGWRWERHRVKVGYTDKPLKQMTHPASYDNISGGTGNVADWRDCPGCAKCEANGGLVLRRGSWRPTTAHEYIFMLTKTRGYFCDAEAAREAYTEPLNRWGGSTLKEDTSKTKAYKEMQKIGYSSAFRVGRPIRPNESGRNPRSVWTFPTQSWSGAHFATFPEELPRRCLKASTSERGCCPACGSPWARVVERNSTTDHSGQTDTAYQEGTRANRLALIRQAARENGREYTYSAQTLSFRPTCECWRTMPDPDLPRTRNTRKRWQQDKGNYWKWRAVGYGGEAVPMTVLDPFCGSGTVGVVARELGHHFIGLDLSYQYLVEQARARLGLVALSQWTNGIQGDTPNLEELPLFNNDD